MKIKKSIVLLSLFITLGSATYSYATLCELGCDTAWVGRVTVCQVTRGVTYAYCYSLARIQHPDADDCYRDADQAYDRCADSAGTQRILCYDSCNREP
jgi:hypothetical protein